MLADFEWHRELDRVVITGRLLKAGMTTVPQFTFNYDRPHPPARFEYVTVGEWWVIGYYHCTMCVGFVRDEYRGSFEDILRTDTGAGDCWMILGPNPWEDNP